MCCRYIPVGLLERLPQKIHDKPPYYFGRDDLETLMASSNCADWIKITCVEQIKYIYSTFNFQKIIVIVFISSELLLGPVPDNFTFLPKHKANAYQ